MKDLSQPMYFSRAVSIGKYRLFFHFTNETPGIRESLKDKDLNFTEIAKLVGEKWQNTDNAMRADCEKEAQATKEKYDKEFAAYKKTPEYAAYQEYLVAFKAKHSSQGIRHRSYPKYKLY